MHTQKMKAANEAAAEKILQHRCVLREDRVMCGVDIVSY